jgi:hypothetical protein
VHEPHVPLEAEAEPAGMNRAADTPVHAVDSSAIISTPGCGRIGLLLTSLNKRNRIEVVVTPAELVGDPLSPAWRE